MGLYLRSTMIQMSRTLTGSTPSRRPSSRIVGRMGPTVSVELQRYGFYTTTTPTLHTTTNIEVVKKFLPVEINTMQLTEDLWKVEVLG